MKGRKIDRRPPAPTGNAAADLGALQNYLEYLRDELNFILTQIYKNTNGGNGNGNGE